jgi:hypothetical protein
VPEAPYFVCFIKTYPRHRKRVTKKEKGTLVTEIHPLFLFLFSILKREDVLKPIKKKKKKERKEKKRK